MALSSMLEVGRTALRFYGISIPLAGVGMLLTNYYEARELQRHTLIRSTLRGVLPILSALLFSVLISEHFWAVFIAGEAIALIAFSVLFRLDPPKGFDSKRVFRATIYSTDDEISRTTQQIEAFCEQWDASPVQQYMAMMSLEEICVATMANGFKGKDEGFIQIVLVALEDGGFELHIRDNAASFNPLAMELTGSLDDEGTNLDALGIAAIKKKAKSFSYRRFQGFNTVIIHL